ncbi:hypothetical protein Bca52824_032943 [Brassica carinata]|uniref:Uncharacterized protein n=1 Tax=Brassica carinata TaxID=52824 RepID=A0A8X7V6T1_BRACI|nr:hypothetical protein Bca52824_032943 [Brassica carinata]
MVIRENTERQYAGHEHEVVPGVIQSFQVTMTKFCSDHRKVSFQFCSTEQEEKSHSSTQQQQEKRRKLHETN